MIKRVAYEPLFLHHLKSTLGIKGVTKVPLHEPLTGLLRVTLITVERDMPHTEIWRALYGAAFFKGDTGKICIAVNDDIDIDSPDAILWAMAYRCNPIQDMQTLPHRGQGHGPKREQAGEEDATLLVDATMKSPMPPLALPAREYMERARAIWEEMGLPRLAPDLGRGRAPRRRRRVSGKRPHFRGLAATRVETRNAGRSRRQPAPHEGSLIRQGRGGTRQTGRKTRQKKKIGPTRPRLRQHKEETAMTRLSLLKRTLTGLALALGMTAPMVGPAPRNPIARSSRYNSSCPSGRAARPISLPA